MSILLLVATLSADIGLAAQPFCQRPDRAALSAQAQQRPDDSRYHQRYCLMAGRQPTEGSLILKSEHADSIVSKVSRILNTLSPEDKIAFIDAIVYRSSRRFWLSPVPVPQLPGHLRIAALNSENKLTYYGLSLFGPRNQHPELAAAWQHYLQQGDYQAGYRSDIVALAETALYYALASPRAAKAQRHNDHCTMASPLSDIPGHSAIFPALFSPYYCLMQANEPAIAANFLQPLLVEGIVDRYREALSRFDTIERQASFIDLFLRTLSRLNWLSISLPVADTAEQGIIKLHYAPNRPERLNKPYIELDLFAEQPAELATTLLQLQISSEFDYSWPLSRVLDLVLFGPEAEQPRAPAPL